MTRQQLLVMLLPLVLPWCARLSEPPRIISVETDHFGNPTDVSTDELFLKYSDGSREYLTRNSMMDRAATFSHDNSRIAFVRRNDTNGDGEVTWDDNSQLVVMDLSDRTTFVLSQGLRDAGMGSWHRDKLELVFDAVEGKRRKLFLYDVSESRRKAIASDVESPAWSFGGQLIAFYDDKNRVAVIRIDGSDRRVITDDVGNGWGLHWAYDGSLTFPDHDGKELWIYDPPSKDVKNIGIWGMMFKRVVDQSRFDWARKDFATPSSVDDLSE